MRAAHRALVACVFATLAVAAGRGAPAGSHAVRYLMGTWCDLSGAADAGAAEAAFQEIARLERILSNWDATSEVSSLNADAGRGPRRVSRDLAAVVGEAADLCVASGGAFDPTVGSLVHAWGFDTESPAPPSREREGEAAARVGCGRVTVRLHPPSIALAARTRIDLGGIGKGYAVDRALAVLRARGVTRAKLDFGSSSLGFLGRVDGGWPVVVADPRDRARPLLSFRVDRGAVASSGQSERSFVHGGRRYGHIFDPRTGAPVDTPLRLVTVIAPKASTADAVSTALFVMGVDRGRRLVSRMPGVGAIFVEERGGRDLTVTTVGAVHGVARLGS